MYSVTKVALGVMDKSTMRSISYKEAKIKGDLCNKIHRLLSIKGFYVI